MRAIWISPSKKLLKLEAASDVLLGDQSKAAEELIAGGAVIEELHVKISSISVIFAHLRKHWGGVDKERDCALDGEKLKFR
ncbi:MAG: hypothetical protein A2234_05680 [Elusimicrobia bacterium RIFOXYA2_FULL_58_8]|nr:MAG: hypothetical protein A2285_10680 [Elusimicrobia bacterium RIFOXYA12_FULL_57_11]OGS13798.1 MAG: hypothetical protein A2234_05680 [Elusimicrobia bacterium RIFOXYA2_FULL_58_8]